MGDAQKYDKQVVVQSNQIVESCYTMSLNEKRLLMIGMSKVDPMALPLKGEPLAFDVTAEEWSRYCPEGSTYRDLERAAKKLKSRYVEFREEVGIIEDVNWFDSARYVEGEGRVSLRFTWTIQKRLTGMLHEFTKTKLVESTRLSSFHAVRLHELLCQFLGNRRSGWRNITLEDFRFSMDIQKKYPSTKDVKKYVINKSILEINEKTSLKVEVEDIKKGRKITGFKFIYSTKKNSELGENEEQQELPL